MTTNKINSAETTLLVRDSGGNSYVTVKGDVLEWLRKQHIQDEIDERNVRIEWNGKTGEVTTEARAWTISYEVVNE